ncbi:MAG TPA: hypothetical protein ENN65_08745 [Candidatus Hydrogenedentes bacterium]|nr:hypothetical protein [Candidatus Hydrogenedentota bacterium]
MNEFIYAFASLAARCEGGETCIHGMRRLAAALHPHGVKITWLLRAESAARAAEQLTEWHNTYGDDAGIVPPEPWAEAFGLSLEEKVARLGAVRDAVRRALPWADPVITAGHTDPDMARVCNALGFEGIWGYCWEQIEVDQITDRGGPWGLFYVDPTNRLRPAKQRSVVALEWTARDLLKSYHSGNPCLYSTDPNDVARGGLCAWDRIDYWRALADNYIRNARYNRQVFLVQHQEAHEMERHPGWFCYTDEDIHEAAVMLEAFVKHIRPHARMMTLAEAARAYRAANERTASSYMLWEDAAHARPNPDYTWNTCPGPWPKTFFFYDCDAQMAFVDGQVQPRLLRNYRRPWDDVQFFAEPCIPRPKLVRNTQYVWSREIEIAVNSPAPMPYGVALWGDFSLYQIEESPGLIEGKILPRELLFLRFDLKEGENRITVRLIGK